MGVIIGVFAHLRGQGEIGKFARSMSTLVAKLTAPEVRPKVVSACVDLVDREVDAKSGLSGLAIKAGYKVVKALKPGFVTSVVDTLLPEFAEALAPIHEREGKDGPDAFVSYVNGHGEEIADALLTVTDARAAKAKNATVKKTYEKLRPSAKQNVVAAVPNLATTLRPYL
jgi:hypothetical protein